MSRVRLSRRTLIKCGVFLILFIIALGCFLLIGNNFDVKFLTALSNCRNMVATIFLRLFTELGSVYGVVLVCLLTLLKKDYLKFTLPISLSVTFSWILNEIIKLIIARPRPPMELRMLYETSFSFVSGHAMNNTVLYFMIFLLLKDTINYKKISWLLGLPFIIAFSRLYFGVHYLTDVLAGISVGLMLVMIFYYITTKFIKKGA